MIYFTTRKRRSVNCPDSVAVTALSSQGPARSAWRHPTLSRPTKVSSGRRGAGDLVFVVTGYRYALLAALRCALEQLLVEHQEAHLAGVGRVGVVDDAVLEREGVQARHLRRHVAGQVGPAGGRHRGDRVV